MELFKDVYEWIAGPNGALLFAVLFGISEAIGLYPNIESNSVYQVVKKAIVWLKNKFPRSV